MLGREGQTLERLQNQSMFFNGHAIIFRDYFFQSTLSINQSNFCNLLQLLNHISSNSQCHPDPYSFSEDEYNAITDSWFQFSIPIMKFQQTRSVGNHTQTEQLFNVKLFCFFLRCNPMMKLYNTWLTDKWRLERRNNSSTRINPFANIIKHGGM